LATKNAPPKRLSALAPGIDRQGASRLGVDHRAATVLQWPTPQDADNFGLAIGHADDRPARIAGDRNGRHRHLVLALPLLGVAQDRALLLFPVAAAVAAQDDGFTLHSFAFRQRDRWHSLARLKHQ